MGISYIIGLDLGQAQDYTAIAVMEVIPPQTVPSEKTSDDPTYHVRHLERVRGIPYPVVVDRVREIIRQLGPANDTSLILDYTGVGRPVSDLFRQAGIRHYAVTIHGGDQVTHEGTHYRVPKRDLVSSVLVVLQAGHLKIASSLPDAAVLVKELENFKVKIDPATAHDSYSAWREGVHDDLVLAVSLAVWYARKNSQNRVLIGRGVTRRW